MDAATIRKVRARLLRDDGTRPDGVARTAPEWLVLCVNNFCNFGCKMCDVGVGERSSAFWANLIGDHPTNMQLPLLERVLDQALEFRPRPKVGLAFTEPLIHVGILDFCRVIVGRGFYCSITSNGYLLPRLADELVDIGVDWITISVDGPPEVHDSVRRRPGSFARLQEGIERLTEERERRGQRVPEVGLSYTITDENYTRLVDFLETVADLSVAHVNFSHINFITDEMAALHNAHYDGDLTVSRSNIGTVDLSLIELDALWRELGRVKEWARERGRPPITIAPDFTRREQLDVYYGDPSTFVGGRRCTDPWRLVMVQTDGQVIPAHGRCFHYPVGNVNDRPLPELWNNARYVSFRRTLYAAGGTLPACSRCCGVVNKPAPRRGLVRG